LVGLQRWVERAAAACCWAGLLGWKAGGLSWKGVGVRFKVWELRFGF
jgi:hypothetical protein